MIYTTERRRQIEWGNKTSFSCCSARIQALLVVVELQPHGFLYYTDRLFNKRLKKY